MGYNYKNLVSGFLVATYLINPASILAEENQPIEVLTNNDTLILVDSVVKTLDNNDTADATIEPIETLAMTAESETATPVENEPIAATRSEPVEVVKSEPVVKPVKIDAIPVANVVVKQLANPLDALQQVQTDFIFYPEFPNILFNPPKPTENPLAVKKLKYIAHKFPAIDGLTRLHMQKLASTNSVISGLKIWKAERKALSRQFILNNYQPLWFVKNKLNITKVNDVVNLIENAENFALRTQRYKPQQIKNLIEAVNIELDPEWLKIPDSMETLEALKQNEALNTLALNRAKLELALSHATFSYVRHASAGQVIPSAIDKNLDIHPKPTSASLVIEGIKTQSKAGELQTWVEAQNPQSKQFNALLSEFKKQSNADIEKVVIITIPKGPSLKLGRTSKRVEKLAMRLEQLGFYIKALDAQYPNKYDSQMIKSVKAYQESKGLKADGIAGANTIGALNRKKPDYLKKLLINLERQRWMPKELGYKHVLVNQAEFKLRVYEGDNISFKTNVVIGKNKFQTPVFYNKIRTVVVNPYWNIPNSIIFNEMKKKIETDGTYLARNNYETIGEVNWEKATSRYVPFRIRQKPGRGNALGNVKFLFPNRHAIYLHDTPSKSLFKRASRNFSHGCVRVQDPQKLALNLMGWSNKQYKSLLKKGKNRHFAMKNKVPVYLTYMTATADETGKLRYFRDVYGRDAAVAKALDVKQTIQKIADKRKLVIQETVVATLQESTTTN